MYLRLPAPREWVGERGRCRDFARGERSNTVSVAALSLQCVAKISSVYWQSNEESVESDKHQRIPVLESRETVRQLDQSLEGE